LTGIILPSSMRSYLEICLNNMINKLHAVIKSQTVRSVGIVLSGNFLSVILGFIFVILTARELGPAEFGIFSTILAYSIFVSAISDLGVSQSIVKFFHETKDKNSQRSVVSSGLISVLCSSVIISFLASLIYHLWLRRIWSHQSWDYSLVLFVLNIAIAVNTYILAYFQTKQQFFARALTDNLFSIIRIGLTFYVLFSSGITAGSGLWIIVWAYIMAASIALFFARKSFSTRSINKRYIVDLLKFGRWLAANSIFSNLYGKLDILMLAWLVSAYHTGLYSAAARFITIFPLIVASLSSVVAPRFAQYRQNQEVSAFVRKMLMLSIVISIGLMALIILGRFIILTAYSLDFAAAVPMFQLLVLAYIPLLLSVPAGNALVYFYKKPQLISSISLIQLLGLFILNLIFIPRLNVYGVIISLSAMNLFGMTAQYYLLNKESIK